MIVTVGTVFIALFIGGHVFSEGFSAFLAQEVHFQCFGEFVV